MGNLEYFRVGKDPAPLDRYTKWDRKSPNECETLEQIQNQGKHQIELDADKNKVKVEECIAGKERCQKSRQRIRRDKRYADCCIQVTADAEIKDGKDQIRHQDEKHPFFVEFLEQVHRQLTVVIRVKQDEAAQEDESRRAELSGVIEKGINAECGR